MSALSPPDEPELSGLGIGESLRELERSRVLSRVLRSRVRLRRVRRVLLLEMLVPDVLDFVEGAPEDELLVELPLSALTSIEELSP